MSEEQVRELLESQNLILEKLDELEKRIQSLEQMPETPEVKEEGIEAQPFDVIDLLSLPDHLRETMTAVVGLGDATAEEVAAKTGRVRNLESSYLNQLVRLGHLKKIRKGRKIYFKPTYVKKTLVSLIKSLRLKASQ